MVSSSNLRKTLFLYAIMMIPIIGFVFGPNDFYWNTCVGWPFAQAFVIAGVIPFNPYPMLYWLGGPLNAFLGATLWLASPAIVSMIFGLLMGVVSLRSVQTIPWFIGMYVLGVMGCWDLSFWLLTNLFWSPVLLQGPVAWLPFGVSQVVGTTGVGSAVVTGINFSQPMFLLFIWARLLMFVVFAIVVFKFETQIIKKPDKYLSQLR